MTVFAIDDEPKALRLLHEAIAQAEPGAEITDFSDGAAALKAVREQGLVPEAVFCDIELPEMSGLAFAAELKRLAPDAGIVFVTGFPKYAADAYRLHASGYILKPVGADRVREELDYLGLRREEPKPDKLQVRCFGHFEVFWQGKPVIFQRKQSKELLAFLIDREGRAVSAEEIAAALWEDDCSLTDAKHRIRNLLTDLRKTLREIGMEDVLIRERRQLAICRDLVECDYYRMLKGDMAAVNAFDGTYMSEYSWAELTAGRLYFRQ
ncbi:MAG: response regulator [Oscillospiraceae bacterium]|nr:response regulator [Oscillospiraceae bacterium]